MPADVSVILIDGAFPRNVRRELDDMAARRPLTLLRYSRYLLPAEARNLALARIRTRYVIFCDNDVECQAGWAEALVQEALERGAALAAPLTLLRIDRGDGARDYIHHSGGRIYIHVFQGRLTYGAQHRLEWHNPNDLALEHLPTDSDDVEFHVFLADVGALRSLGGFDERLVICDHDDLSLRIHALGRRIVFVRQSVVRYDQTGPLTKADRAYFNFRWHPRLVTRSCDTSNATGLSARGTLQNGRSGIAAAC